VAFVPIAAAILQEVLGALETTTSQGIRRAVLLPDPFSFYFEANRGTRRVGGLMSYRLYRRMPLWRQGAGALYFVERYAVKSSQCWRRP
jgi:hypothetical protein